MYISVFQGINIKGDLCVTLRLGLMVLIYNPTCDHQFVRNSHIQLDFFFNTIPMFYQL